MFFVLFLCLFFYEFSLFACQEKPTPQKPVFYVAKSSPRAVYATPLVTLAANIKNLGKEPYDDAFKNKQKADYLKQIDKLLSEPQVDMRGFHEFIEPASPYYVPDIATLYREKERAYTTYYSNKQTSAVSPSKLTPQELRQKYNDIKTNLEKLSKKSGEDKTTLEDVIIKDIKTIEQNGGSLANLEYEQEREYGMFLIANSLRRDINSFRVFKALIEHGGINPNLQTKNVNRIFNQTGWTPLMLAIQQRNIDVIKYLLALPNITLHVKKQDGESALALTAYKLFEFVDMPDQVHSYDTYSDILKLLLNAGAPREDAAKFTQRDSPTYNAKIANIINNYHS